MRLAKIVFCLILIFLVHGVVAWSVNQPQDAGADVPSGKLQSLSFAPYHNGFSPLTGRFPLPEHIDEDLRLLADKTDTIRTYSVLGGMEPTPLFARKYGVSMIQGGWLGDGHIGNQQEIKALIESANANQDVVKRVIVGNEVLLRKDMDVDKLIAYIREVKQSIKQSVSYADVWSIYLKHPQLIKEVDFITIHILPYWEDEPVAIGQALNHLETIFQQIEAKMLSMGENKPILIGESGWPAAGRQRGMAIPSVLNQAQYIRGLIQLAQQRHIDYNIVEAFDQAWKSHHEGVVGANWGLFSTDRQAVFPFTGQVTEQPQWQLHFYLSLAVCLVLVALCFKKLQALAPSRLLIFLVWAQLFGVCLVTLADVLWHTSYDPWQQAYTVAIVVANAVLGGLISLRSLNMLDGTATKPVLATCLRFGYLFFILLAIVMTLSLAINGRYLSFPLEQFAIPVLGIIGLAVCQILSQPTLNLKRFTFYHLIGADLTSSRDKGLGNLLFFSLIALVPGEAFGFMGGDDFIQAYPLVAERLAVALNYSLHNGQLLGWLGFVGVLGMPLWADKQSGYRHKRA